MKKYMPEYMLAVFALAALLALTSLVSCNDFKGQTGDTGPQGPTGAVGPSGVQGLAGFSALIKTVPNDTNCANGGSLVLFGTDANGNGTLDASEVSSSADLCNGLNGSTPASPQFTPVIAITPCGPKSSSFKEVLLGLTGGGVYSEIITNLSDNATIRNTLLPDASYYDTDDSKCNFTIATDSHGNRSVTWNGSTQNGSGPFSAGSASFSETNLSWSASYGPIGD